MSFYDSIAIKNYDRNISVKINNVIGAKHSLSNENFSVYIKRDDGKERYRPLNFYYYGDTFFDNSCCDKGHFIDHIKNYPNCGKCLYKELQVVDFNPDYWNLEFSLNNIGDFLYQGRYIIKVVLNCRPIDTFYIDYLVTGRSRITTHVPDTDLGQYSLPVEDCKICRKKSNICHCEYDKIYDGKQYEIVEAIEYRPKAVKKQKSNRYINLTNSKGDYL